MSNPIHASEMRCYQRCPREWQHAYQDERAPLTRSEALERGTAMHQALAAWRLGQFDALTYVFADVSRDPMMTAMMSGYVAVYQRPDLVNIRVNVPFQVTVDGVGMAGELDAIGTDPVTGATVIEEDKTTSSDISPGSVYWTEMQHCSVQTKTYLAAFPGATIRYNVLRKPALRKLRAGKTNEETDVELAQRMIAAMADEPSKYFARATFVMLDGELESFLEDVACISAARVATYQPRNTASCFSYGRRCSYWPVCFEGKDIADDTLFGPNDHAIKGRLRVVK